MLAGGGPEQQHLWERLGERAAFLGWLEGEALARVYASADIFLFASRTDTFGQVILEAQASGLPVVAVDEGGPSSLIRTASPACSARPTRARWPPRSSCWRPRRRSAAGSPRRRRGGGVRSWRRSLGQLADGYRRALAAPAAAPVAERAAA